jgi:hypothetical protein
MTRLTLTGVAELRAALQALPAELAGEAGHLVEAAANGAALEVRRAYGAHRVTGNLQEHVLVNTRAAGPLGVNYQVKSSARHAWLFEYGTQARHYVTVKGRRHVTGRMPPANLFVPIAIRARRAMAATLVDLLERHGLTVTGTA